MTNFYPLKFCKGKYEGASAKKAKDQNPFSYKTVLSVITRLRLLKKGLVKAFAFSQIVHGRPPQFRSKGAPNSLRKV